MWHIISTDDWQAEDELPTPDDSMERAILRYGVKKSIEDELDAPSVYVRHSGCHTVLVIYTSRPSSTRRSSTCAIVVP